MTVATSFEPIIQRPVGTFSKVAFKTALAAQSLPSLRYCIFVEFPVNPDSGNTPRPVYRRARLVVIAYPAELNHQIHDDGDIDQERHNLRHAGALCDFVDLDWKERSRGYDRHILGPALAQSEPGTLGQKQSGI